MVRTREEGDATDVVIGIFLLYSIPIYALIDTGSSYSYVSSSFIKLGNLKFELSKVAMVVSNPLGQTVLVDQVCRPCPLEIHNRSLPIDLSIMPFGDFDLILGMDWLTEHGVILDCRKKKSYVQSMEGEIMEVKGTRSSGLTHIISLV